MIIAHTGRPGSGKSYEACIRIIDELRKGRVVYSNIDGHDEPTCREALKDLAGLSEYDMSLQFKYIEDKDVEDLWDRVPQGAVVVIDEAQNFFNSRKFMSRANEIFNAYAAKHRHHGNDLILITQNIARLDSAVRSLVEWTYDFRKINFLGSLVRNGYQYFAYIGEAVGPYVSTRVKRYDRKYFHTYMSYVTKQIKEQGFKSVKINVLKNWRVYAVPVVFGIFFYTAWNSSWRYGELVPGPKTKAAIEANNRMAHMKAGDYEVYMKGQPRTKTMWVSKQVYESHAGQYELVSIGTGNLDSKVVKSKQSEVPSAGSGVAEAAEQRGPAPCRAVYSVDGREACGD